MLNGEKLIELFAVYYLIGLTHRWIFLKGICDTFIDGCRCLFLICRICKLLIVTAAGDKSQLN